MGGSRKQEEKEKERNFSPEDGETGSTGGADDPTLPPGWSDRTISPNLPNGWRSNSTGCAAGTLDSPASGRGGSINKKNSKGGGGEEVESIETTTKNKKNPTQRAKTKNKTDKINMKFLQKNCDGFMSKKKVLMK